MPSSPLAQRLSGGDGVWHHHEMAVGLVIVYGVWLVALIAGGAFAYRRLRSRGRVQGAVAAFLVVGAFVLAWPIPIHGGVMFLGEAVVDELRRDAQRARERRHETEATDRRAQLSDRFAGPLPFEKLEAPSGGWSVVRTQGYPRVHHDRAHGLLWSAWTPIASSAERPSLDEAKQTCRRLAPAGFWSLPTEAEHCLAREAGGARVLGGDPGSGVSYVVDLDFGMELVTYRLGGAGRTGQAGSSAGFGSRCVARTQAAPVGGYTKADVPLERWNRCQLSK